MDGYSVAHNVHNRLKDILTVSSTKGRIYVFSYSQKNGYTQGYSRQNDDDIVNVRPINQPTLYIVIGYARVPQSECVVKASIISALL